MRRKILLMTFLVAIIGFCGTSLSAQVAKVGDNGYASVIAAIQAAIEQKVSEVTLLENSSEVMPTDVEFLLKADLKITANSPVTAEFYNNGTSYDFIFNSYENGGHTLTIGENVTFNLKDRIIWAGYYGDNITVVVEGTLIGGYQYWCGAKTKVTETGTLKSAGEALVLRRGTTLEVDGGKIEANYFSFLSGKVIAKNNATITSGPIWVSNEGGYANEGNVELTLDNSTWTSSGNIQLNSTHDNGVVLNVKNGATLSASSKVYGDNVIGSSAVVNVDNAVLNVGTKVANDGEINATNGAIISTPKDVTIEGDGNVNVDEYSSILPQGTVAKIGTQSFETFAAALTAANNMTGDVTVEIYEKVEYADATPNLTGAYDKISFVGKTDNAEISITRNGSNGYISGGVNDCNVSFTDLILSKPAGSYANDAGNMNNAFTVYRVGSVSYTKCSFPNGACAAGCPTSYIECTFKKSHDKYAVWAYGSSDININKCEFDDDRGIKMYAEGAAKTTAVTVTNCDFSKLTGKPAIVATLGKSITLSGNTYSDKGVLELEDNGSSNGIEITSTDAVTCISDAYPNGCGVLVNNKIYRTVTEAAAVATKGSTVTLLHNSTETVTLPAGVTLDKNGYTADGVTEAAPAEVATYDELVAALANGGVIKLTADITVDTKIEAIDGTVIDLNDKTLYVNVENSYYNNVTIKNGNIVLGKDDVHVCDGYFEVNEGKTLELNDVNVSSSAEGIKGYAVFHLKTGANLDLINSTLNIADNEYAAGYIVYAGEATATVDVVGTTIIGSKVNGIVHATTVIDNSTLNLTNVIEHGINRSGVTIDDSNVTISGGTGRGITAQHGPLNITGNSVVSISEMGEATIELRNNQNLTVAETATVTVDVDVNNTTSGTITGNITVNESLGKVAKIGNTYYKTLQEAIDACEGENNLITLLNDITFESDLNNAGKGYFNIADGKKVVLDMNGKTINVTDKSTGNFIVFYNYGEFTIANGTINLTSTNDREWNAESAIVLNRGGIFNIENGTYTHNGGTDMAFVVDNSGNYYGDATTNIYERTLQRNTVTTKLTSSYIAIRNRMEQNSHGASGKAILNVEGGTISGTSRAIWAQAASTSETAPATGEINVKGGNIGLIDTPCSTGAVSMTTISGGEVSAFKGEAGELTVTGGTLNEVTLLTAAGEAVNDYAVNKDGLYVQAVAQVGVTKYADLQEAIKAAAPAGTVKILADVVVDEWIMFSETLNISSGQIITMNIDGLTINGNGKTVTINSIESASNGNRLFFDATNLNINNLTINCTDAAANQGGIGLTSGTIENVTFNGGAGVFPGTGEITIKGCTFETNAHCIYYEEARDNLVVTGNTFKLANNANVILLRGNTTFTGNTIVSGRTVNVVSGSPVVTGNNFGQVRFKVYNEATATIEENTINVLAFNDPEAVVNSTFAENTLSEDAQAVLDAVSFPVAQIGDVKYGTLQAAVDAAQDGEEIDLLKSVELTSTLLLTKNNILDGNGFRLTPAGGFTPDGNNAVIVLAANMSGYEANRTYTVKNLIIAEFSTPSRIVRANFCNATIQNCSFVNNNSESIITSAYAVLNVKDNTFTYNTASFAVINVGSDVSDGTALVAEITGNKFYNNEAAIAGIFLASSADVTDNHFKDNTHTGDNANAAAILAGPYTGNMAYTVNINSNAFENAMSKDGTALPSVFAEDWSANYGSTTSFDLSLNYWDGNEPVAGTAYKTSGENPQVTVKSYYTTYTNKTLGGLVELPQGNQPIGYVSETTIWGQTWTNAKESYVIKVLNAENEVMGTSALNTNLDVTMDGDVEVTWHITLPGITDEDQYWIQEWIAKPNVNNMPAKVELWVDGVEVNEGPVKFNGPDDIHKIYAATADAEGNLIRFYNSIETIVNNEENVNVVLVRDVTGSFETFHNVTLYSGVEGGASITNTYSDDYTNFNKVIVKNGVTLNMNRVYSTTAESVNTIEGTMNVVGAYYHSSDAKTEIKNGGKVTTGGMTIVRYNYNPESGIYIYGDGDDTTIEFSCQGDAIGAYSGTFYAEDAVVETEGLRLDFKKESSEESDSYAQINAKFVDTKLSVSSELRLYKDAALTLNGATVTAGKVQIRQNATPTINIENSTIKANSVENLTGATWNAVMDEDGYVTFVRTGLAGEGTEANPYLINNLEDLVFFRDQVNGGNNYAGKHVELADNIDLSSIENWTPIGDITYNDKYHPTDTTKVFSGNFNGNGNVISNLKVASTVGGVDTQANVGLFGITGEGAAIKDLTLTNVNIETDGRNVGAIAGFAYKATLSNITVNGDIQIKGGNNVAGIAGMTRHYAMSATGISVIGNDGSAIVGNNIVGGIFAEIAPNDSEQTFKGLNVENVAITGVGGVGGIVGLLTTGTVENVSVKNVVLTGRTDYQGNAMGRIRLGSVAGLMGGKYATIANETVENVTAKNLDGNAVELPVIGANYDAASNATEAKIGYTYYATLQAALDAGGNVTVLSDITLAEKVTVAEGKIVVLDLNGKTIDGTDNTSKNFSIIDNRGNLTITDSSDPSTGKITLTATTNSGWSRYSAVIANNPGGKLTIEAGTLEHSGGTDMAYGIDNLTNGKGTYAETVIKGGTITSTYRGIRQFLNGVEAQNILTVNGGTIEGTNKSIWMQDPSKNANTGTLTVDENATLNGDVYLSVTAGSTEWPVEVSIAAGALQGESTVLTANLPVGYDVQLKNGVWGVYTVVAKIDDNYYATLSEAFAAVTDDTQTVVILSDVTEELKNAYLRGNITTENDAKVTITLTNESWVYCPYTFVLGANITLKVPALFYYAGGAQINGTVVAGAYYQCYASTKLTINEPGSMKVTTETFIVRDMQEDPNAGIYVIGDNNDETIGLEASVIYFYQGMINAKDADIKVGVYWQTNETDGIVSANLVLDNSNMIVTVNEHNMKATGNSTVTLTNASNVTVAGGYEGAGVMNVDSSSTFNCTKNFLITANGTMNNAGTVNINSTLTNNGTINFTGVDATLATTTANLIVKLDFENSSAYQVVYENGTYSVALIPVQEQSLVAGWNWYSSYLDIRPRDLTTALGENGLEVKDQNDASMIYDTVWGTWTNVDNYTLDFAKMYMINTTEACELKLAANVLNPADCPVTLNGGWNWIGYPSNVSVNINDALEDLTPNDGDMIKTRNLGHAEYVEAWGGWIGKLTHMIPGEGYMYRNTAVDENENPVVKEFYYTVETTSRGTVEANYTAENEHWVPNVSEYPFNMTMTAVVDGMTDGNYEVAAFVNGEVRGSARPIYVEQLDAYVLFLTINGDEVEEMSFRLYDIDNDTEYDLNDRFNYSNNAHLGSVSEPYVFSRGTTGIGEAAMSNINIYPNPTTIGTEINLKATCDIVEVYNALGVKVAEYQNVDTIDALETAGIYVIRITNNGNVQNCRLVVK